jgi:hypothetical protein
MRTFRLAMIAAVLVCDTSVMAGDIAPGGTLRTAYLGHPTPARADRKSRQADKGEVILRATNQYGFCPHTVLRATPHQLQKNSVRQTALRLPEIPRLAIAATISCSVKSGCLTIRVSRKSACSSNGEVLPPLGFAATLPVCSKRCAPSTTTLALSSYRSATSRHDAPASIASITRARKSLEYGLGIDRPLRIESCR